MQAYPDGGGNTLHHHYPAVDDDYFSMDDHLYNTPRQSMLMGADQRLLPPKQNTMSAQRSPDLWTPQPKHYYYQMDGYGGHDQNNKHWSGNYSVQYPQVWPEKEQHYSVWKSGNGYPVPGEINGGYRRTKNEQRPYYYEQNKAPPVWIPKGIID